MGTRKLAAGAHILLAAVHLDWATAQQFARWPDAGMRSPMDCASLVTPLLEEFVV